MWSVYKGALFKAAKHERTRKPVLIEAAIKKDKKYEKSQESLRPVSHYHLW